MDSWFTADGISITDIILGECCLLFFMIFEYIFQTYLDFDFDEEGIWV